MPFDPVYHDESLSREDLAKLSGPVLLEFGANWCGICQAFSPELENLLEQFPQVQHIRVADAKGKPLGRSFRVKLWPTCVFSRDGQVVRQDARPTSNEVLQGLQAITSES